MLFLSGSLAAQHSDDRVHLESDFFEHNREDSPLHSSQLFSNDIANIFRNKFGNKTLAPKAGSKKQEQRLKLQMKL